jgi:hypothetical protein
MIPSGSSVWNERSRGLGLGGQASRPMKPAMTNFRSPSFDPKNGLFIVSERAAPPYPTLLSSFQLKRFSPRGGWGASKSDASNATIGIDECVYLRVQRLKLLTVNVRAGTAIRRYKVVKADGPEDRVFQAVSKGAPRRDNNILSRHIKPAARKMGLGFVNWRCLRTSHATWLKMAGADVKDAQAQMRHLRSSTTLDVRLADHDESGSDVG